MSEPVFRDFDAARDRGAVIDLLSEEEWTFRPQSRISAEEARAQLDRGDYAGDAVLTVMIELDDAVVGFVRAEGLGDEREDPQLDFRLRERVRGKGIGLAALRHITAAVFERQPKTMRIEGQTRSDNVAMRKVFARGGYVQEAVYRQAWPAGEGRMLDGVGYAILRSDWESGTTTPVVWDDTAAVGPSAPAGA